jgi:hypothetical protein
MRPHQLELHFETILRSHCATRLQCQRPFSTAESEWQRALDDGGRFLDAWGADAATMLWLAGELFDVPGDGRPGGLVWQLKGERVTALGEDRARLADGRTFKRHARWPRARVIQKSHETKIAGASRPEKAARTPRLVPAP